MKLPLAVEPVVGVNLSPAAPWATVMKCRLAIAVVPSFWNRVPPVMSVIWKLVTKAVSATLGVITRPEVVCVFSIVVASVTLGVCNWGVDGDRGRGRWCRPSRRHWHVIDS